MESVSTDSNTFEEEKEETDTTSTSENWTGGYDENGDYTGDGEYDENGKVVYRTLSVPKLCVVPLSSLKLKEISVDFKVKLYGKIALKKSEPQQQTNALKGATSGQRPPQETGYLGYIPGLGRRDSPDNYAQISLKFESEDPPEGLMRISDQLTKVTL